jgi:hypothetical protein
MPHSLDKAQCNGSQPKCNQNKKAYFSAMKMGVICFSEISDMTPPPVTAVRTLNTKHVHNFEWNIIPYILESNPHPNLISA